jgi:Ala-tRNA(Pro) deacylase
MISIAFFHDERPRHHARPHTSADELTDLTGLESGAVPPLGRPILPFDLYLDPAILDNQRIAFNADGRDASVIMPTEDYLRVARPTIFRFALID